MNILHSHSELYARVNNLMNGREKRKANWTEGESLVLLEEFEKRKELLLARFRTYPTNKQKHDAWQGIMEMLNARNPYEQRTIGEVRRKWKNMVNTARTAARNSALAAEGKIPTDPTVSYDLNPINQKVIELAGVCTYTTGHHDGSPPFAGNTNSGNTANGGEVNDSKMNESKINDSKMNDSNTSVSVMASDEDDDVDSSEGQFTKEELGAIDDCHRSLLSLVKTEPSALNFQQKSDDSAENGTPTVLANLLNEGNGENSDSGDGEEERESNSRGEKYVTHSITNGGMPATSPSFNSPSLDGSTGEIPSDNFQVMPKEDSPTGLLPGAKFPLRPTTGMLPRSDFPIMSTVADTTGMLPGSDFPIMSTVADTTGMLPGSDFPIMSTDSDTTGMLPGSDFPIMSTGGASNYLARRIQRRYMPRSSPRYQPIRMMPPNFETQTVPEIKKEVLLLEKEKLVLEKEVLLLQKRKLQLEIAGIHEQSLAKKSRPQDF